MSKLWLGSIDEMKFDDANIKQLLLKNFEVWEILGQCFHQISYSSGADLWEGNWGTFPLPKPIKKKRVKKKRKGACAV